MNFVQIILTVTLCTCVTNVVAIYRFGHFYKYFLKELYNTAGSFGVPTTETAWIDQPLDHFDENENRTWKMRYFESLDYWKDKGPIYLFINGEWEANDGAFRSGVFNELAKETNGAMYASEHRYYGESKPFEEFSTENLRYLSSRQALADIAKLLKQIKKLPQYNESKVVVIGGSYAGNLAAWMKLLYPELVDAAIASSAPVLAKKDFYEYLETVSDDFEQYGTSGCHSTIKNIFNRYDQLMQTSDGIDQLKKEEEICDSTDMMKPENRQLFFLDKTVEFMYEAQYSDTESIKNFCDGISTTSRIVSSKEENDNLWSNKKNCFNYDFDYMIESMKQVDWITAWIYQTCTEFGYFMSSSSSRHPFTDNIPIEHYYNTCIKMYGSSFDEERVDKGVQNSNEMYGGLRPNVTHVVFVNGELDPWHRLGVTEDISYDAPAKLIPRSSHCKDLLSDKPKDPEELKEARKYVKYLIKKWIGAGEYAKP